MFGKSVLKKIFTVATLSLAIAPSASATLIVNGAQPITEIVTVQPIIVSDNDGFNTANFFGTLGQQSIIEGMIDTIWAQAGIDVNFLSANTWDNTFANWGAGGSPNNGGIDRPTGDLTTIRDAGNTAGVSNADPFVINMYFVNIAAGFGLLGGNSAAGLAFLPGNGVTQYVGTSLLSFTGGQEAIAGVVAHEIGHNLGLPHTNDGFTPEGLMTSGGDGERLTSAQITIALGSNLSVTAVPVPAAIWFMISGLAALFGMKRKSTLST